MVVYEIEKGEDKIIPAYDEYRLIKTDGKGKTLLISFVASSKDVILKLSIDGDVLELPEVEFFYNSSLTTKNDFFYCQVYDTSNNNYGLQSDHKFEFNERFEAYLMNKSSSSITLKNYVIVYKRE